MNRRNFLKSLGVVCGAVVVAPAVLLKVEPKDKPDLKCYGKHGQRCVCNSCVDDMMVDCLSPIGPYHISGGKWYDLKVFKSDGDRITYRTEQGLPNETSNKGPIF